MHVFEMLLLGFVDYPPFGLELYTLMCLIAARPPHLRLWGALTYSRRPDSTPRLNLIRTANSAGLPSGAAVRAGLRADLRAASARGGCARSIRQGARILEASSLGRVLLKQMAHPNGTVAA